MNTTSRRTSIVVLFLVVAAIASLAGCSGSSGAPIAASTTAASGASAPVVVHIKNYAYDPAQLDVKAGDKVTFVNDDKVDHTATANDKSFDTGTIKPGARKTITVKAGTKGKDSYFCTVHNYMKGALVVAP